ALNVLEAAFAGQRMEGFECRFKTVNEEWKWLAWSSSELVYEEGVVFAYGKDISELKEAERNLVQFKKVLDSSQEGVAIYTPATNSSYLNHALQEMMGYSPDDFQNLESPALV
ncbi:PAS domain-containing protein, partial [Flavihumibacter sediminis]|nr:PAS domain-containing protein [Flavihumibacter sediminis]